MTGDSLNWSDIRRGESGIHGLELEVVGIASDPFTETGKHGVLIGKQIWKQDYLGRDREGVTRKFRWHGTYSSDFKSSWPDGIRRLAVGEFIRIGEAHSKDKGRLSVGFGMAKRDTMYGIRIIPPFEYGDDSDGDSPTDDPVDDTIGSRLSNVEEDIEDLFRSIQKIADYLAGLRSIL